MWIVGMEKATHTVVIGKLVRMIYFDEQFLYYYSIQKFTLTLFPLRWGIRPPPECKFA